ncbi:hypothetical protein F2P56_008693 [Juglans regia]|uniref:Uncharacterized protein n=1 Tax=Juglans regia TaxID=51240 RepID=A0A834D0J2_JUGRE|nr:hypothetical protein F2P56_008693 [Juglans regia]
MEIVSHLNVKYPNEHKLQVSLEELEKGDMCELNEMQVQPIIALVEGLSNTVTDFECRATENISNFSLRPDNLTSEYHFLIQKADILLRTVLLYKQGLQRKCSNLEKAKVEVDPLGDVVNALLSLLENINIALDHYSPILKHYPGVGCFSLSIDYIIFMFLDVLPRRFIVWN